jgi:hypothetical protein
VGKNSHDLAALAAVVRATEGFGTRCNYCGDAGHLLVHCPKEAYERWLARSMGCLTVYNACKKAAYGVK